ncbi:acetylcholine receptor subunit alpha-1-A-like [Eriocheir sinensis]|uniref:acetylcholine receptor subunit alpha-1-A-like n=1 Tax=Eriocheir sinensis TaxID=95602 RepID=UPI0021C77DFD|nr:acetylcholine receptor subunit alpha-1-A-like [Eriocheir sinensis]
MGGQTRAWAVLGLCMAVCFLECAGVKRQRWQTELSLKDQLLNNYDMTALPPPANEPTVVRVRIKLLHVTMDEKKEAVLADAWLVNDWDDPRLTWLPDTYNNITSVDFPHNAVWKPDLGIYNSAQSGAYHQFGERLVNVSYTGRVLFVASIQLHYSCVVDLTFWPHDTHNCTLMLGSWHHSGASVDLQIIDDKPQLELMTRVNEDGGTLTRGWWRLVEGNLERQEDRYDCCPEPYVSIKMSLVLTREAPAFRWTVKMPVVALCILTFIMFLLPPCAGEKLIFGSVCLILDVLFIAYTSVTVAHAPSHTPLIVKLVCQQLLLTVSSIIIGAITTRLARDPHSSPLSPCLTAFLHLLSGVLCLGNYRSLVLPMPWQTMRSVSRQYSTSVKTEELELGENGRAQLFNNSNSNSTGNGSNHVPTSSASSYSGLDYLLLAAVIDRLCLVIFVLIFIINMLTYSKVL